MRVRNGITNTQLLTEAVAPKDNSENKRTIKTFDTIIFGSNPEVSHVLILGSP